MSSVGDATTVVDGHATTSSYYANAHGHANGKPRYFNEEGSPLKKPHRGVSDRELSVGNFATAVDYMEEERPFFVKIGKDGLIAALQKLDGQLRNVRAIPSFVMCGCVCFREDLGRSAYGNFG